MAGASVVLEHFHPREWITTQQDRTLGCNLCMVVIRGFNPNRMNGRNRWMERCVVGQRMGKRVASPPLVAPVNSVGPRFPWFNGDHSGALDSGVFQFVYSIGV
jgi:hypothetical protein